MVTVGLFNYGYALLLTHLLSVAAYSRFAAGQGLILWATNVAAVTVPWVLAQALIRAQSDADWHSAIRFAKLTSSGAGAVAATLAGAVAIRFAGPSSSLAIAFSTFVIFLGGTTTGWLQGQQRMQNLSFLYLMENLLKNGAGVLLVLFAGLGDTGALAAFGIGGMAMVVWWPRTPSGTGGPWLAALANRDLWRRAVIFTGAQAMLSLFIATDVVLVALLPEHPALGASYQASATLSRIPLYIAGAVAGGFFPSLSRRAPSRMIIARAVQMYAAVALPLAVVLATIPPPLLAIIFPAQYSAMPMLLRYTAVSGLAVGGINLVTTFLQAADDYSSLWRLAAGLAGYIGALLVGWRADGITGLAAGGAVGAAAALTVMGYRLVRREGRAVLARIPLAEPVVVACALIVLRPHPLTWLAVAGVVGVRAAVRFVQPDRHTRRPRWVVPGDAGTRE